ncbi:prefoldin-related [Cryptosporidium sp. chipmunk genotype I]|uniref:prefoldin-related n=1 Tax=Cryptosporidium sp. chipmunk genotype I TaxID=1280935 RepID=UPI00351A285B|nr:prefoldin-related [Cryptosporidium sp. chipmunk genotype I]
MALNSNESELITKDFLETQKKFEQINERRRILVAQESENQMVSKELELLESDAVIYKLIGSVMVKQSLDDAKSTVSKRLEYITGEIESVNKSFESLQSKLVEKSNQVSYIYYFLFSQLTLNLSPASKATKSLTLFYNYNPSSNFN